MNDDAKEILKLIETYLQENPEIRFTQALFNLGVNTFRGEHTDCLRDNYNDTDKEVLLNMQGRY